MKKIIFLLPLLLIFTSCMGENKLPQLEKVKRGEQIAIISTTLGDIKIKFFSELAPKSVENFITHAKNNYYDETIFHRVINNFMIQGGDPTGTGYGGESIWHNQFENEISDKLFHIRGALSMANAGANTNGSQFFIVQNNKLDPFQNLDDKPKQIQDFYEKNGGCPYLDGNYSVFGQVFDGMDVVDKIAQAQTDSSDKPLSDIKIISVTIKEYE